MDTKGRSANPGCQIGSHSKVHLCQMQWHTPVPPATWESEAGRAEIQVQPGQLSNTMSQNKEQKWWGV